MSASFFGKTVSALNFTAVDVPRFALAGDFRMFGTYLSKQRSTLGTFVVWTLI